MSVVKAEIQTVEDMYRLIWTAVANKRPVKTIYKERPRLFCPHRLGRNRLGQPRACLAISTAAKARAGWGQSGRRRIGVASFSRNCAEWNY